MSHVSVNSWLKSVRKVRVNFYNNYTKDLIISKKKVINNLSWSKEAGTLQIAESFTFVYLSQMLWYALFINLVLSNPRQHWSDISS